MTIEEGTYRLNSSYTDSLIRQTRLREIIKEMRTQTDKNYQEAEEARRLARLGILELRKQRGLDIRPL